MEQEIVLSEAVFKTPSYYCNDLAALRSKITNLINKGKYTNLIRLFFCENTSFFQEYEIQLEGERPNSSLNIVYDALAGKELRHLPLFEAMSVCADFASLYGKGEVIDRSSFVAKAFNLDITRFILPFFILLVEYGMAFFPRVKPKISIENGIIRIIFSTVKPFFTTYKIDESDVFKLLIDELGFAEKSSVMSIFETQLKYTFFENCLLVSYQFDKPKNYDRTARILNYIYAKQIVSANDVANYFNISKRTANYLLTDLVNKNILIRVGVQNSSLTRYKVNEKEYINFIN